MDDFYTTTTTYTAFQETVQRDNLYVLLDPIIDQIVVQRGEARILELGAGRTGYPDYLRKRGVRHQFDAQDVTAANLEYLHPRCHQVLITDLSKIEGPYDLVLSTFVLEHVTNPTEFLENVRRLLAPGGWHAIFCPRYDLPGYLCPSLRHLPALARAWMRVRLAASRIASRIDRKPRFWVNCDPSVLHGPWYRDADAVHLVSRYDVERWHFSNGFSVHRICPRHPGIRGMILNRFLTLNLLCQKPI